jgi:methionyl-tRNA formyltransferase
MKLVFMGTPDFAAAALAALHAAGHEIVCVYTQPPRPSGRGQRERKGAVHALAESLGLPVRTPKSLKTSEARAEFAALGAEIAIVAAYGLILPKPVLAAPRLGCVNIHASLLPRWRGAAPIHRALLAGDSETGITIMQMDEGLDTGAMLMKRAIAIDEAETAQSLHDRLRDLGAVMIVEALPLLERGDLPATSQPEAGVTYAAKLTRADSLIDWTKPAHAIERQIRALNPWPGVAFTFNDTPIKLHAAGITHGYGAPGTVLDDALTIACGDGALRLTRVQRPGRAPMEVQEFLRGFPIPKGAVLR